MNAGVSSGSRTYNRQNNCQILKTDLFTVLSFNRFKCHVFKHDVPKQMTVKDTRAPRVFLFVGGGRRP
jgi:hypothetical protein